MATSFSDHVHPLDSHPWTAIPYQFGAHDAFELDAFVWFSVNEIQWDSTTGYYNWQEWHLIKWIEIRNKIILIRSKNTKIVM